MKLKLVCHLPPAGLEGLFEPVARLVNAETGEAICGVEEASVVVDRDGIRAHLVVTGIEIETRTENPSCSS